MTQESPYKKEAEKLAHDLRRIALRVGEMSYRIHQREIEDIALEIEDMFVTDYTKDLE